MCRCDMYDSAGVLVVCLQHDIAAARTDFNAGLMGALAADGSPAPRTIWAAGGGDGAVEAAAH